jgi:hypothetical protein
MAGSFADHHGHPERDGVDLDQKGVVEGAWEFAF